MDHHHHEPPLDGEELPQLLVIHPPHLFKAFEQEFSAKFNLLKAYESPLPTETFLQKYAQSAEAIFCFIKSPVDTELLRQLPSLRLVVTAGTGVNHVDLAACRSRGIAVTNTAGVFSEDTADYTVALLIDVMRKISGGDRFVRRRVWPVAGEYPLGFKLRGKQVGIIGLGNIGSKVAKRLESFGCKISYNSRTTKPSISYKFYPNVYELASHCDILVVCCPLTEKTHHLINDDVMAALGKSGVVVNIGRGPIIDEKALVKRLLEGEIAGAGLDVFEHEPNVPTELFGLDNVVLSPHRGAFTEEAFYEAFRTVTGNLDAFFSGKPLLTPVDINE